MNNYITDEELKGGFVEPELIKKENMFIRAIRSVFSYHYFNKGGHGKNSQHGLGKASDGHLVKFDAKRKLTTDDWNHICENIQDMMNSPKKDLFDQMVLARICGFNGVGGYKNWKPVPGIHKDIRKFSNRVAWVTDRAENLEKLIEGKRPEEQVYIYIK